MMSRKVLFVLAAMSLIPIARSCDMTMGYPLPVAEDISLIEPLSDFVENYRPVQSTVFLLVNLAVLLLLGRFLLKKIRPGRWLASFYDGVLFISFVHWSGLLMCYVAEPPEGTFLYKLGDAYWVFIGIFATEVPAWINSRVLDFSPEMEWRDNIVYRVWFTFVTAALVFIFYGFRRLADLRRRRQGAAGREAR